MRIVCAEETRLDQRPPTEPVQSQSFQVIGKRGRVVRNISGIGYGLRTGREDMGVVVTGAGTRWIEEMSLGHEMTLPAQQLQSYRPIKQLRVM